MAVAGHPPGQRNERRPVLVRKMFKIRLPVVNLEFRYDSSIRGNRRIGMRRARPGSEKGQKGAQPSSGIETWPSFILSSPTGGIQNRRFAETTAAMAKSRPAFHIANLSRALFSIQTLP